MIADALKQIIAISEHSWAHQGNLKLIRTTSLQTLHCCVQALQVNQAARFASDCLLGKASVAQGRAYAETSRVMPLTSSILYHLLGSSTDSGCFAKSCKTWPVESSFSRCNPIPHMYTPETMYIQEMVACHGSDPGANRMLTHRRRKGVIVMHLWFSVSARCAITLKPGILLSAARVKLLQL